MDDLLSTMMQSAVLLRIMQLNEKGGPGADDMKRAQEISDKLGERGDVLICGGGKVGERAALFNGTAHAVAVLAFVPGGVDLFGTHFEAAEMEGIKTKIETRDTKECEDLE